MPSVALREWQTNRLPRLNELDGQAVVSATAVPPNPTLADENLRGYVVLLTAHFQGFCRDLYGDGVRAVVNVVPAAMQVLLQTQCWTGCALSRANPTFETIRTDFERFGFDLSHALKANPATATANARAVTLLGHLNVWRNYAAHHNRAMPAHGGPFGVATIRTWKAACDGLAVEFDRILYDHLLAVTGAVPW